MTIQEFRLDLLKQGYRLEEKLHNLDANGVAQITIFLGKKDTDGLEFQAFITAKEELWHKENTPQYTKLLRDCTNIIAYNIQKRRNQNPKTCEHKKHIISATSQEVCELCMEKFGEKLVMLANSMN